MSAAFDDHAAATAYAEEHYVRAGRWCRLELTRPFGRPRYVVRGVPHPDHQYGADLKGELHGPFDPAGPLP